jgi:16S rRNA (guanine966-N2)-methyltransferase
MSRLFFWSGKPLRSEQERTVQLLLRMPTCGLAFAVLWIGKRVRIIAGEFRGRRLLGPRGGAIRPTSDRVREALFSKIAPRLPGARVLDLFAGSGALGLEAVSRGAVRAVFVDQGAESIRIIQANIKACGAQGRCRVIRGTLPRVLQHLEKDDPFYDLIFMDPPYGKGLVDLVLPNLKNMVTPDAWVVVEHRSSDRVGSAGGDWVLDETRAYGDTRISFFVRAE